MKNPLILLLWDLSVNKIIDHLRPAEVYPTDDVLLGPDDAFFMAGVLFYARERPWTAAHPKRRGFPPDDRQRSGSWFTPEVFRHRVRDDSSHVPKQPRTHLPILVFAITFARLDVSAR